MTDDPRVCPADGADHDWQDRTTGVACGRGGQSWPVQSARCGKCGVRRLVMAGQIHDTPARP